MILLVPIHLDALSLKTDQPVLDAKADFTRLPYTDGTQDINGDVAYISEEIVSEPFQDRGLYLKAGIHLHWALPDALTKGVHTSNGTNFPDVPNRWLVIRSLKDGSKKQWVIESDYLYPNGKGEDSGSISFPVMPPPPSGFPFRFLGRKMTLETWKPNDAQAEYLNSLTAVGYGEPTFAAFYPNCFSVFGFHDDDFTSNVPDGLQYDVIGWYSDSNKDCLKTILINSINGATSKDELVKLIGKEFKWTVSIQDGQKFPTQTLYYTRLAFKQSASSARNTSVNISSPDIIVANTGTEALSAYLANALAVDAVHLNDEDKSILKSQIEDQLEALFFSSRLSNRQLDVGPKFQEARHEKGFSTVSGGTIWSITPRSKSAAPADSAQANMQQQITLPDDMGHQLSNVNILQQDYGRALEEIESLRRQLFSDWYKYLLCAYPPDDAGDSYPNIDEVMNFIELNGLAPLKKKIDATGELKLQTDDDGNVKCATSTSSSSLASQLADALTKLVNAVNDFNNKESMKSANTAYYLKQVPGPRYYQPNDPVVLLMGDAVTPSLRHGQDGRLRDDGLLECQLLSVENNQNLIPENIAAITSKIDEIKNQNSNNVAFSEWSEQPWNPFLLEWEAEVFPVESGSNLESQTGAYQTDFINRNFTLKEDDVDFSVREGKGAATKAANVYTGSSILTPYAGIQLTTQIEAYLKKELLQDYYEAKRIPQDDRSDDYFIKNARPILDWYKADNCKAGNNSALCNIIRAYEKLTDADFHSLSQSLGGFNESLLMHKQTMQLDIADPLAFDDYQPFANAVKNAVEESIISAPQPLNDFNPIRSGAFKLLRLRLVDTFGQVLDLNCENATTTEQLKVDGSPYEMNLPTRLTQPARVNFRWLSAIGDDMEMNAHPATSPICGWLLPNNLDRSLMIYDSAGKALGSINRMAKWETTPGSDSTIEVNKISNPHLQKVVKYLLAEGKDFLLDFISAADNALENIEPENFAQHQDIALLMGSPIALVRASVNLELQGLPAVHQGWNVFRQDLKRDKRETDDFDKVEFPIRIGEYKQFNDGVVGYWKESDDDYEGNIFYAPQSDEITNAHIKTHHDDPMTIYQTVTDEPQFLTMLVDPRGSVHVTSGILPVKAITIPPDQYADALKAIEITFLSAPVLTELNKLRLPLSNEPGFRWSWLQKDKYNWTEITTPGIVRKQTFLDAFADKGEDIWNALVESAWIVPQDDGVSAVIVPKDRRGKPKLDYGLASQSPDIEDLLEQAQISGITNSVFPNTQRILEGWLKLSNT